MRKKKYKFTDKKHSTAGIISTSLGICAFLMTAGGFGAAYLQSGLAGKWIAVLVFLSVFFSGIGLYYGFLGIQEEDAYHFFPKLGCFLNSLLLILLAAVYFLGW